MKRIASFSINHDTLVPGMYTSRVDGDIVTYDVRMKKPNNGDAYSTAAGHTFEHLFATYVRNTDFSDGIIYVGPMGCRTGFYFLVRDCISPEDAIQLVQDSCDFILQFDGPIPGATRAECGNYLDHDLAGCKELAAELKENLAGWTPEQLAYPE